MLWCNDNGTHKTGPRANLYHCSDPSQTIQLVFQGFDARLFEELGEGFLAEVFVFLGPSYVAKFFKAGQCMERERNPLDHSFGLSTLSYRPAWVSLALKLLELSLL